MDTQPTHFEAALTTFFMVKTSPEWLAFPFETRLAHARETFQPILDEFKDRVLGSFLSRARHIPR